MLLLLLLSAPETKNSSNDTDSVSAFDSNVGGTNAAIDPDPFHVHCFCFYCNKHSIIILVSYRIISFHPIIKIMMIRFDTDTDIDPFRVLRFCFGDPSNSRPSMFPLRHSK